jgi:DNA repair exonuclease SbcCD ATPase subunit
MADNRSIETRAKRLDAAMEALEIALGRQAVTGKKVGELQQQMHAVAEDRSRLAQELDRLKQRAVKLEGINDDVAQRLQSAIGAIEELIAEAGSN